MSIESEDDRFILVRKGRRSLTLGNKYMYFLHGQPKSKTYLPPVRVIHNDTGTKPDSGTRSVSPNFFFPLYRVPRYRNTRRTYIRIPAVFYRDLPRVNTAIAKEPLVHLETLSKLNMLAFSYPSRSADLIPGVKAVRVNTFCPRSFSYPVMRLPKSHHAPRNPSPHRTNRPI